MSIDNDAGHQKSSLGKFRHISRWSSSISSAEREIPKSAHRPSIVLNGGFFVVSARRRGMVIDLPLLVGRQRPNRFKDCLFKRHLEGHLHYPSSSGEDIALRLQLREGRKDRIASAVYFFDAM
jgi:hypothetical protein